MKRKAASTSKPAGSEGAATLVYDGTCGSCSWFARMVARLDSKGRVKLSKLEDPAVRRALEPKLGERYDQSFHLVEEETGTIRSGEDALLELARLLPAVKPFAEVAFALPGVRRVPSLIYRTAAAWRRCVLGPPSA